MKHVHHKLRVRLVVCDCVRGGHTPQCGPSWILACLSVLYPTCVLAVYSAWETNVHSKWGDEGYGSSKQHRCQMGWLLPYRARNLG